LPIAETSAVPLVIVKSAQTWYADGRELEEISDLPLSNNETLSVHIDTESGSGDIAGRFSDCGHPAVSKPPRRCNIFPCLIPETSHKQTLAIEHFNIRQRPTLIRNLNGYRGASKMSWNPHASQWETNDYVIEDLNSITSIDLCSALYTQSNGYAQHERSFFRADTEVVGNMKFDPIRLCWKSSMRTEDDDVFHGIPDYDSMYAQSMNEGTISGLPMTADRKYALEDDLEVFASVDCRKAAASASPDTRFECTSKCDYRVSQTYSNGGSIGYLSCIAEQKHRLHMKGWTYGSDDGNRMHLQDIRAVAMRQY